MSKFEKIILVSITISLIMALFILLKKLDEQDYLIKELKTIEENIEKRYHQIDSINTTTEYHRDTIRLIEKKKETIINNYYKNEKNILAADDSTNHQLRIRNQKLFEQRYFGGRYNPKIIK
jgi:restriction endonuclease S subunit